METNFNLGSLKTIQAPLLESLNVAHENVKKNISIFVDEKKIPTEYTAIASMDELEKIFKMIGLSSLAIIFNLNKEALAKVKAIDFDTETNVKVLQAVEKILENSRNYVKSLINGANDQPTKFFDDYQNLASLLRKQVSVKDLFNPRLDLKDGLQATIKDELRRGVVINANNKKNLLENLKVIESVYLTRLLDFKKVLTNNGEFSSEEEKEKYHLACKNVYEKFDVAQKLKISKSHYILFGLFKFYICILSPVFNENFKQYVQANKGEIEDNLENMRKVIVSLAKDIEEVEEGSKTGTFKINDLVVKEFLFSIINAVKEHPSLMGMNVYNELSTYFNLEAYSEQLIDTKIQAVQASKLNFSNIEKLFNELKEDFTLIGNKKQGSADGFKQHVARLLSVSNKLAESLMSVKEVHVLISQVAATLAKVRSGNIQLTETVEKELSIALVLIEYGVNNIIKSHVEGKYRNEFGAQAQIQVGRIKLAEEGKVSELAKSPMPKLDSLSQKSDERKSYAKIFEQVSQDLVGVEETLDLILNKKSDGLQSLEQSVKSLHEMRGIFSVIGKLDLVPPLEKATNVWRDIKAIPDSITEEMRESIVLISGISLFVKSLRSENESEAEEIHTNILKRYNTGLFKPEVSEPVITEIGVIEAESFDKAGKDEVKVHVAETVEPVKEIISSRDKEEIVEDFYQAMSSSSDSTNVVELVEEFLHVTTKDKKLTEAGSLLVKAALAINNENDVPLNAQKLQETLSLEILSINSKNKSISTETKNVVKAYADVLGSKDIAKLNQAGKANHEQLESLLSGLFSRVVLVDLPAFDALKAPVIESVKIEEAVLKVYAESPNDEELGDIFKEEAAEVLEQMKDGMLNLANDYDKEALTTVRRYFHTLKGSGRMVGLDFWGEAAWMTEQTLNRVLNGEIAWSEKVFSAMKEMQERFNGWLGDLQKFNHINVDLVSVKLLWQGINDKLTNHVEIVIPEILVTEAVVIEVPHLPEMPTLKLADELGNDSVVTETTETEIIEIKAEDLVLQDLAVVEEVPTVLPEMTFEVAEEDSVMSLEQEVEAMAKEDVKQAENITINGKEVPAYLYKLYKEESVVQIAGLKKFVHENYGDEVELDSEFMRNAHTLASISKTVNLQKIAAIAVALEDVSFFTSEREVKLNSEQMNIVRHAVDSLELFQDINSTADVSFYETVLGMVEGLFKSLVDEQEELVEEESFFANSEEVTINAEKPETIQVVELESQNEVKVHEPVEPDSKKFHISEEDLRELVSEKVKLVTDELKDAHDKFMQKFHSDSVSEMNKKVSEQVEKVSKELVQKYEEKISGLKVSLENAEKRYAEEYAQKESVLKKMYDDTIESIKSKFETEIAGFKNLENTLKGELTKLKEAVSRKDKDKEKKTSFWQKFLGKK